MKPYNYLLVFVIPGLALLGMVLGGSYVWLGPVFVFGLVPLLELVLPAPADNASDELLAERLEDWRYDAVLYAAVPIQLGLTAFFLLSVSSGQFTLVELAGATLSVGLCCGGVGINMAHELGHRPRRREQFLAKLLLGGTLYAHFFIEHNRGHHTRVATADDPATARRGEWVFSFWFRSVIGGWRSAWKMEWDRLSRRGRNPLSRANEMVRLQVGQALLLLVIGFGLGLKALLAFVAASLVGILLLETVNYLEHYGLERRRLPSGRWERVRPCHSWNSNCVLGRLLLFELSRHSDHHAHPKRPYPALRHFDEAPQLPTGYPGMILLSLVPPLFHFVMDQRVPGILEVGTGAASA
ncbi:MAG: alkane 1-monooxygenase [Rickettsiales bacterium]|nr:alkane 1-monooxygenase [Rickettsiales bacterium]|tara:strand:- start:1363 stop:2424 length:1062 start_codon:yes stop_codon:yes gene_type:complete